MTFQNSQFSAFYQSGSCAQIIFNSLGKLEKSCLSCSLERGPSGISLTPLTKCLDLGVTRAALIGDGGPPTPNTASGILCSDPCPSPSGLPPSHLPPSRPAPGQSGFLSSLRPIPYWPLGPWASVSPPGRVHRMTLPTRPMSDLSERLSRF